MEKRGDPLIGRRLREARERRGLTQDKLSEALTIGRSTIAGIEGAHRPAGRKMLENLGEFFAVPMDYFTTKDDLMAQAMWVLGRIPREELEAWVKVMMARATAEKLPPH